MKSYFIVLFLVVSLNIFFMLFSIDRYTKSLAAGVGDMTFIVIGSLFLIFLFFIFAFMLSKVSKY